MRLDYGKQKYAWLKILRFAVQTACLIASLAGFYYLVQGMGLPKAAFIAVVVLTGLSFCGWFCPFGTIQEWLRHIGKNATGITLVVPRRLNRYLLLLRYAMPVLAVFLVTGFLDSRRIFFSAVTGKGVEAAAYAVMGIILFLALFVDRPFCKYLCGFGALYGLSSVFRIFTMKRDAGVCAGCGKCDASCPMGVEVSSCHSVRDPHCINCFACVAACPVGGALKAGLVLPGWNDTAALKNKYLCRR